MSKKKRETAAKRPDSIRVAEIALQLDDEACVLGPLDKQDLQEALTELIELRAKVHGETKGEPVAVPEAVAA